MIKKICTMISLIGLFVVFIQYGVIIINEAIVIASEIPCEEDCEILVEKGHLKQGLTVKDCIEVLCNDGGGGGSEDKEYDGDGDSSNADDHGDSHSDSHSNEKKDSNKKTKKRTQQEDKSTYKSRTKSTKKVESTNKMLFTYSPGCPHCNYQKPIVREFERAHPEVQTTWVKYYNLDSYQRELIKGTSGHPVMVFYDGDNVRRVVGETSTYEMVKEYDKFKRQVINNKRSTETKRYKRSVTTGGSGVVCY